MENVGDTEGILKAARENSRKSHTNNPHKAINWFSAETLEARRGWHDKVLKEKKNTARNMQPSNVAMRTEEYKEFPRCTQTKTTHQY